MERQSIDTYVDALHRGKLMKLFQGCISAIQYFTGFNNSLVPSSKLIQRPDALLFPLSLCNPERLLVLHDVCKDSTSKEDHVFSSRWILYADLKVLSEKREISMRSRADCLADFQSSTISCQHPR
jgi:hypothetical protein